jgi:hypothetical protein
MEGVIAFAHGTTKLRAVEQLEQAHLLVHNSIPVESIFKPASFGVINTYRADWYIIEVSRSDQ